MVADTDEDDFEEKERLLRERALQSMKNRERALASQRPEGRRSGRAASGSD